MRTFLKNALLFTGLVFVYLTCVFAFNFYNENHPSIKKYNISFIGDSHTRYSVIPDSFCSSINYGLNGDPIITQKWKIKTLSINNKIDTVILSLGYHTFGENFNALFSRKDGLSEKLLNRYLFIDSDFIQHSDLNNVKLLNAFAVKLKKPTYGLSYLGTYIKIKDGWDGKDGWRINQHFQYQHTQVQSVIKEIEEIIKLCEAKKIICFFHFPPTTYEYKKRVPNEVKTSTDSFLNVLHCQGFLLPTIKTLPDSCFFDPDHLNYSGAKIYTHSLKQALYNKKNHQAAL